jgi:hypothetical protein
MSNFVAINTLDLKSLNDVPLHLAALESVTQFFIETVSGGSSVSGDDIVHTSTVPTFWNSTVIRNTCVAKSVKVLLRAGWPAIFQIGTLRFRIEVETNNVGAVKLALKIDQTESITNFLLLLW